MPIPPFRGVRAARVRATLRRAVRVGVTSAAIVLLGACSSPPPSVAPTVAPTPIITPNPHLTDPTTASAVYRGLGAQGLRITANNAVAGDGKFVERINATYMGWPLNITEYSTARALDKATSWDVGDTPGRGEVPIAFAAANVLVTWGPQTGARPQPPDPAQAKGLTDLVVALDRLLSPMRARSVVPISAPGVVLGPVVDASGSPDATTADGRESPKP